MKEPEKKDLNLMLRKFNETFSDTANIEGKFIKFVDSFDGKDLYDRKNFAGHLTASAFIVDNEMRKFLLLFHRGLGKWLQPGGHIEDSDGSILLAAKREVEEELGLTPSNYEVLSAGEGLYLFDVDSHYIPANGKKGEPEHYHHDVRFLFRLKGGMNIMLNEEEASDFRWFDIKDLPAEFDTESIAERIKMFACPRL